MLWSRSASLMTRTRQSFAIATSILRTVAACWASREENFRRSSFVTPSTISATTLPNSDSISATVTAVSSTTSWRSAATTLVASRPRSATIWATAMEWVMYGSPDRRRWPSWAREARAKPRRTIAVSRPGWRYASVEINGSIELTGSGFSSIPTSSIGVVRCSRSSGPTASMTQGTVADLVTSAHRGADLVVWVRPRTAISRAPRARRHRRGRRGWAPTSGPGRLPPAARGPSPRAGRPRRRGSPGT